VNPPPPPPLELSLSLDTSGTTYRISATALVSGTVTCSQDVPATLSGTITQRANRFSVATASFGVTVNCSETTTPWTVTVSSTSGVPFNPRQG